MNTLVLGKIGPRLIDFYRAENRMNIAVNGPGMLIERLELVTNKTALEGASVEFYRRVADGLLVTIACPHEPIRLAEIAVETHRLGPELSIELGPTNMYQNLLKIHTVGGETFRELIDASLGAIKTPFVSIEPTVAMLVAVRAAGHHEHHTSKAAAIRRLASNPNGHKHAITSHGRGE